MHRYSVPPTERQRLQAAWQAACYRVQLGRHACTLQVDRPAPDLERRWPGSTYALVTAFNPPPGQASAHENALAARRLEQLLDRQGWPVRPAEASDDQGRWREPGWLIRDLSLRQAGALARRFRQGGLLFWRRRQPVGLQLLWPLADAQSPH